MAVKTGSKAQIASYMYVMLCIAVTYESSKSYAAPMVNVMTSSRHERSSIPQEVLDVVRGPLYDKRSAFTQRPMVDAGNRNVLYRLSPGNTQLVTYPNGSPRSHESRQPLPAHRSRVLPGHLGCQPRNVTRVIRYSETGCVGNATFAVCDGYCKTATRTKKVYPYFDTRHRSCHVNQATAVMVTLDCTRGRRVLPQQQQIPVIHALTCSCKQCSNH